MRTRLAACVPFLVAAAFLTAGCSSPTGPGAAATPPLQLRLVTSSSAGTCSVPRLTTDGPGNACDREATTTYVLGELLGTVTPTSVTTQGHGLYVELDKAGTATMRNVTTGAIDKQVAILLDGRVLAAPLVKEPLSTGNLELSFATTAEAEDAATALHGTKQSG